MNFNAGPATLPLPALERAQAEMLDFAGTGISVMEHSHRGKEYEAVHDEAIALLRELLGIPGDYDVLFMQGGASMAFALLPMNFLPPGASADHVITGAWSEKAHAEAAAWAAVAGAQVKVAASTRASDFTRAALPAEATVDPGAVYVHFASNETIHGVQIPDVAAFRGGSSRVRHVERLLVAQSRRLQLRAHLRRRAEEHRPEWRHDRDRPPRVHQRRSERPAGHLAIPLACREQVVLNTPPTFGIFILRNVLAWLKELGGLGVVERRNRAKAAELYAGIDAHPGFYRCPVDVGSRSVMNVVFRLPTEELEARFVDEAKKSDMLGLGAIEASGASARRSTTPSSLSG